MPEKNIENDDDEKERRAEEKEQTTDYKMVQVTMTTKDFENSIENGFNLINDS